MENIYYARSANEQGQKETVFHHLSRASELCQEFLSPLGYGAWGEVLGKFHDFGKYSEDFQQDLWSNVMRQIARCPPHGGTT